MNEIDGKNERRVTLRGSAYLPLLLVSLVFTLLLVPLLESSDFGAVVFRTGLSAVLIFAALATRRRRSVLVIGLLGVVIVAPMLWATAFLHTPWLFAASCMLQSVFFFGMAVIILNAVMRKHLATLNSIIGAVCAYLLIGLAWAIIYLTVDSLDPGAFNFPRTIAATTSDSEREIVTYSQLVYFSFVTMSTLGYGDIAPKTGVAQTLTWMQSVLGQFYMAVIVAWLVGEIPRRKV